ncbi:hypothetical protein [Anaerovibrio sp. RM50]|uniref:Cas10/Cmr2 second palm domain-containing protein n=1 Tax=Anaerovibrio sp. RM50 TaxID=1200557 RepID=UPI00047F0420|nr:hypothetical protein [Anaerovibrio sp. RM50]
MEKKVILLDVRSIQRYIYAANKLRTNIGASYIVENLFSEKLVKVLEENFKGTTDLTSWKNPDEKSGDDAQCQIAYIGGGNAMVLFDHSVEDDELKRLVALFSQKVMEEAPGLHIGAAIGALDLSDDESYKNSRNKLFAALKQNQNNIIPNVSLPYTGFTQICDIDGEAASYYDNDSLFPNEKHNYYSHEAAAKAKAVEQSNKNLEGMFEAELMSEYVFPTEIDRLGQKEQKSYIAVVHIDGNNMGVKFSGCNNLAKHRTLSAAIKEKTKNSFAKLLTSIVKEYAEYKEKGILDTKKDHGKNVLPIRPLILGGDDVTFVCPAQVAVAYAKRFIKYMKEESKELDEEARSIDCCGGISILPEKYPFFRGYVLSEQLCDAAKKQMRKLWNKDVPGSGSSWLDFVFLHGEQAPTLEQILKNEYSAELGKNGGMHFGPYCVIPPEKVGTEEKFDEDHLLDKLIECATKFNDHKHYMAKNKVKELRAVLQKDKGSIDNFMVQLSRINQKLPDVDYKHLGENCWGTGVNKGYTPFVDAIEMMEYIEEANK